MEVKIQVQHPSRMKLNPPPSFKAYKEGPGTYELQSLPLSLAKPCALQRRQAHRGLPKSGVRFWGPMIMTIIL